MTSGPLVWYCTGNLATSFVYFCSLSIDNLIRWHNKNIFFIWQFSALQFFPILIVNAGFAASDERLSVPLFILLASKYIPLAFNYHLNKLWNQLFQPQTQLNNVACDCTEQDLETFDLEDFKYNFVNISAFRMVDADNEVTINLLRDMEEFQPIGQNILNRTNIIQVPHSRLDCYDYLPVNLFYVKMLNGLENPSYSIFR